MMLPFATTAIRLVAFNPVWIADEDFFRMVVGLVIECPRPGVGRVGIAALSDGGGGGVDHGCVGGIGASCGGELGIVGGDGLGRDGGGGMTIVCGDLIVPPPDKGGDAEPDD